MDESETPSGTAESTAVQSVDRALHILELLADTGPMSAVAIARELTVHRSTAFRLLATLEGRRFVAQDGHRGTYSLGSGALRIAGSVVVRMDLAREAQAICDEITAQIGETSNVAILDDGAAVNIAQATGTGPVAVRDQYVGQRTPLHATSSGKILLAFGKGATLEQAVRDLQRFTDATIVDPGSLREEVARVRVRGWGSALAEWQEHTNAVAVPVFAADGSVVAALSTTAPAFLMTPESMAGVAEQLNRYSREFAKRLGYLAPRAST